MAFRYVSGKEAKELGWDSMLSNCSNRIIYANSWWLDIVSPRWFALVDIDRGLLFPLPVRKKYGVQYVFMPPFTQQLGLFGTEDPTVEQLAEALSAIPSNIKYLHLHLNEQNTLPAAHSFTTQKRENVILDLQQQLHTIRNNYSEGHRRNIRMAGGHALQPGSTDADRLIELFRDNRGADIDALGDREYAILRKLLAELMLRGLVKFPALYSDGELLVGAAMIQSGERHIFLFSGQSERGKEQRAMFFLIDQIIGSLAERAEIFDFEGSVHAGLRRFYLGFGGRELVYLQIIENRLPFWLKWLKE